MQTHFEAITAPKNVQGLPLAVCTTKKTPGAFIIQPVGPLNTHTYKALEKQVEFILASNPEIIIFDMEQVNYINARGLRVILKTIKQMRQRVRAVYIMNPQPQIKEMFKIINGLLPQWIFTNRKELKIYLKQWGTVSPASGKPTEH